MEGVNSFPRIANGLHCRTSCHHAMFMLRTFIFVLSLAAFACSGPSTSNPNEADADQSAGGDDAGGGDAARDTGASNNGGDQNCAAIGERFTDAVRAIPRDCVTDADCVLLPRAQVCDCDLAVSAGVDTAEYDAVRAEADAAQCANPFGCPMGECPYRKLSQPGELYPHCNDENQCEVLQIMNCTDYQDRAHGGMFGESSCMESTECTLRNDLNACNCNEAVSTNFPFLTVGTIYEVIEINNERCDVTCMGCQGPDGAVCGMNDEGYNVCQTE